MKHRVRKPRLSRVTDQRKSLVRSLLTSLLIHGSIKTTESRAKVVGTEFDKLVSAVGRQSNVREQVRYAKQYLFQEAAQRMLLDKVLPEAKHRSSGFTRTTRMGPRDGDSAEVILIELFISGKE